MQAWTRLLSTLELPESPLSTLLSTICAAHVKVVNIVLAYNPKSKPKDLRCAFDHEMWKVERSQGPSLFVKAWNQINTDLPIEQFKRKEWGWILDNLLVACRRAVCSAGRTQFDDTADITEFVGDKEDGRHAYFCVGAIYRSLMNIFLKILRIMDVIKAMFVCRATADKLGLTET